MKTIAPHQQAAAESLLDLVGPLRLRYCPLPPTPRQEAFLRLPRGRRSTAVQPAEERRRPPDGGADLLRRPRLSRPDPAAKPARVYLPQGLIPLSQEWLAGSKATWTSENAQLELPERRHPEVRLPRRDQGRPAVLREQLLLCRLRRTRPLRRARVPAHVPHPSPAPPRHPTTGSPRRDNTHRRPVRIRAAGNPGGSGHAWVKARFVDPTSRAPDTAFLSSQLSDNPHLDPDYITSLTRLPNAERERLLNGNWDTPDDGELFQRDWFDLIERHQLPENTRAVRFWDRQQPSRAPPTPTPTTPSASASTSTRKAAPFTSPTSSASAKRPERSNSL